jgi:hypothetical protein
MIAISLVVLRRAKGQHMAAMAPHESLSTAGRVSLAGCMIWES